MYNFWENIGRYGKMVMLIDPASDIKITYEEAAEKIETIADKLRNGKRLAFLFCGNNYSSIIYYMSLLNSGTAVLLLDYKLNNEMAERLINLYKPEIIIGRSAADGYILINLIEDTSYLQRITDEEFPIYTDTALLLSTSGTTGSPKLVRLSYKNIQTNASSIMKYLSIDSQSRSITSLPMSYSFGLSVINSYTLAGASILLTDRGIIFRDFWELFKQYECTSFSGVPYSYEILRKINFDNLDIPTLNTITQAGGRLSPELIRFYLNLSLSKGYRFFVMYGQTEASARISYVPFERLQDKIGSIGIPVPGGTLDINPLQSGRNSNRIKGELIYKGDNVMLGYASSREDLSKGDEMHSVLSTGDMGYMDNEGFFYLTGRLKRFIKLFGLRINLDEVEEMIESHFHIYNACSGTDDHLFILLNSTSADSADKVRYKAASYYNINLSAITVRFTDKMPLTDTGKKDYTAVSRFF